jgi:hypothetical protein
MMLHPKNKIVLGLFVIASTVLLALGLLFYSFSNSGINTSSNNSKNNSDLSKVEAQADVKDAPRFNIFSILNRFIPN